MKQRLSQKHRSLFARKNRPLPTVRRFRQSRFEALESRRVLAAPSFAALPEFLFLDQGQALNLALDGFDADGDDLTYTVSSSNQDITAEIPDGNRSMRISVDGFGDMVLELFEQRAPLTTSKIIDLAESGFYEDKIFHRVMDGFMIQGGSRFGNGTTGTDEPGYPFADEFNADLRHGSSGILSMANSGPNTNNSQFFITDAPTPWLNDVHTVFGFLTDGDDVRKAISETPVTNTRPNDDVVMNSVTVFDDTENGTLMLKADQDDIGQSAVTVTVSDGNQTYSQTIQVVTWGVIPLVEINLDDPLPGIAQLGSDIEDVTFSGSMLSLPNTGGVPNPYVQAEVDSDAGTATISPVIEKAGVYAMQVLMRADDDRFETQTQIFPVFVNPTSPTGIELVAASDTGTLDGITALDNSPGKELSFLVSGVTQGAVVSLYAGPGSSAILGSATVTDDSGQVTIETNGTLDLIDGPHLLIARQEFPDLDLAAAVGGSFGPDYPTTVDLTSDDSPPLEIIVASAPPDFIDLATGALYAAEGTVYRLDVDTIGEIEASVSYAFGSADIPSGMTLDTATGEIIWPNPTANGTPFAIEIVASDGAGNQSSQTYSIEVSGAPRITAPDQGSVVEGQEWTFTATFVEPDGEDYTVEAQGLPSGATFDTDSGQFAWTPSEAQGPGQYEFIIRATDVNGLSTEHTVAVDVAESNLRPSLGEVLDQVVDEHEKLTVDLIASDDDLPSQDLFFDIVGEDRGALLDPTTGRFSWTPGESYGGGDYSFTVRVKDSYNKAATETFSVAVEETDSRPVIDPIDTQFITTTGKLEVQVTARDLDRPAKAIRYSLEGTVPEGASIDADSGLLTWNVADAVVTEVETTSLTVRATEVLLSGADGRWRTTSFDVVDLRAGFLTVLNQLNQTVPSSSFSSPLADSELFDDGSTTDGASGAEMLDDALLAALAQAQVYQTPVEVSEAAVSRQAEEMADAEQFDSRVLLGTQFGVDSGGSGLTIREENVEQDDAGEDQPETDDTSQIRSSAESNEPVYYEPPADSESTDEALAEDDASGEEMLDEALLAALAHAHQAPVEVPEDASEAASDQVEETADAEQPVATS